MISVTLLDGTEIVINSELIEHIKIEADTVVTLTNGTSFVVREQWHELVERVIAFKQRIISDRATLMSGGLPSTRN
ncbi:MAG: flagellar FlbD family protein [Desulfobacteraceae bacterium]|nr:flagellar FlbD family protein [Desulfobacteraceae bacterium]